MDAATAKLIDEVEAAAKAQMTATDSIIAAHNRYAEELDVFANENHETVDVLKKKLQDMSAAMRENTDRIVNAIKHGTELAKEGPDPHEHGDDASSTTAAPAPAIDAGAGAAAGAEIVGPGPQPTSDDPAHDAPAEPDSKGG